MNRIKLLFPAILTLLLVPILIMPVSQAATISLEPDSTFITTGVGSEFDLELTVDASTDGIRLFQVIVDFDTTILDTVSTALGPLFDTSGNTSVFNSYIYYDSTHETTILRLEGLLFGADAVVDGPGVVANVRFATVGTGIADLTILEHVMTDILNDPIESEAEGATVFVGYLPAPFDLMDPDDGIDIPALPGTSIEFVWTSSTPVIPGEDVLYQLELSTSPTFDFGLTYDSLTDTTLTVPVADLTAGHDYYWRVTAYGSLPGYETPSSPYGRSFFLSVPELPDPFTLVSPSSGEEIVEIPGASFDLVWTSSYSPYAGDDILYFLEYSTSDSFEPGNTVEADAISDTSWTLFVDDLQNGSYFWRVTAYGSLIGLERESTPFPDSFILEILAAFPGAFDLLDPVDASLIDINFQPGIDFSWQEATTELPDDTTVYMLTLADDASFVPSSIIYVDSVEETLSLLVPESEIPLGIDLFWNVTATNRLGFSTMSTSDFQFVAFWRGDMDHSRSIDITDLVFLVTYMFGGGEAPTIIEAADTNCDGSGPDISDLVYLVAYMFSGGSPPACP